MGAYRNQDFFEDNKIDTAREERRKRIRRKRQRRNLMTVVLIILLLALAGTCIFLLMQNKKQQNAAVEAMNQKSELEREINEGGYLTQDEVSAAVEDAKTKTATEYLTTIQTMMENGDGTLAMLETLYPEKVVVPESGRYYFFEILDSLKKNDYSNENFVFPVLNEETKKYEGEATYSVNGEVVSHKGIDVSKFQGDIKWDKVAADGVEFAYIRLGYRGYGSGKLVTDEKYEDNIQGCNDAGIDTGVYFFTEALTEKEAIEEADYVLDNLEGYRVDLPIVLDVEESASKTDSRTKDLTAEDRTKVVIAFCNRIKEAGYDTMIYGNLKSLMLMVDLTQLESYDKWFAYYHYPLHFPYQYRVWQYTASGTVDGIAGSCDLNIAFY